MFRHVGLLRSILANFVRALTILMCETTFPQGPYISRYFLHGLKLDTVLSSVYVVHCFDAMQNAVKVCLVDFVIYANSTGEPLK